MDKREETPGPDTYTRIVNAMETLSKKKSYSEITIRELCAEAGASSGSFYHFFKNKHDVIRSQNMKKNQMIADNMAETVKGLNTCDQMIMYARLYARNNVEAGVEWLKYLFSPSEKWYTRRQPMISVLEDIVRNGQNNGSLITSMSYLDMTEYFVDILRGESYIWCMQNGAFDLEERLVALVRILLHAFVKVV